MRNEAYGLALVGAVVSVLLILELLRRRKLSEKYAVIWLVLGSVIVVLAVFPELLEHMADLVGIAVPANLLFFGAAFALLLVCLQLSAETTRLEDKTRTLAEEIALLRQQRDEPPSGA
ncbi:MAG: hypothetical protein JWM62_2191 [Frankiales bacterium]|nr:hypothetical protein [Frankiales bacterium]